MTDISVSTVQVQSENLSWDLSNPGVAYVESGTISVAAFTAAQHFPNGFIPSGTVLGKITASGLLGPYLGTATDGRQTAVGVLQASVQTLQPTGVAKANVGCAVSKAFAVVSQSRLPFTVGNAAGGGYVDAAAVTALPRIHFAA